MVQAHLADVLPKTVEMGKVGSASTAGFRNALVGAFEDRGWWLYAVLDGVTLILMIVITRLFPKAVQEGGAGADRFRSGLLSCHSAGRRIRIAGGPL